MNYQESPIGKMPLEWQLKTVEEVKAQDKHAMAMGPFGSNIKTCNYVSFGIPVIRGVNLNYYKYPDGQFVYLSKEKANELNSSSCYPDDLIFSHRGNIGQVGLIPHNKYKKYIVSQSGMKLSVNKDLILPLFAFYFFKSVFGQNQLLQYESQVGVPAISNPLSSLKKIILPIPPLPEQRAIASVLSSLDDKIDLLHRQNATLEAMAEALFKQWFMVEAKEEWEYNKLSYFGNIICGKTPPKTNKLYFNGEIPFIKIPDMHSKIFINNTTDTLSLEGANSQKNKYIPKNSICVSCIATVGLVAISTQKCQTNQQINSIIPSALRYLYYLFLYLRSYKDELIALASGGTATLNLNTSDFSEIEIVAPPDDILENFHKKVHPIFDKIWKNQTQIRTLEKLRDSLLSKLMSGEVRVKF